MRLQRVGLEVAAFDSVVYDVYSLVREGGEPLRCEGASCYRPLLDSPGWADAVAGLAPREPYAGGAPPPQAVRYLVEGRAGSADFTLTVKRWRIRHDPPPPPCVPVRPPAGHPRWQGV